MSFQTLANCTRNKVDQTVYGSGDAFPSDLFSLLLLIFNPSNASIKSNIVILGWAFLKDTILAARMISVVSLSKPDRRERTLSACRH